MGAALLTQQNVIMRDLVLPPPPPPPRPGSWRCQFCSVHIGEGEEDRATVSHPDVNWMKSFFSEEKAY